MKKIYGLLMILCLSGIHAFGSHMAGADLTYRYLGNNQYEVVYTFYRDCSGISAPTTVTLDYSSNTCNIQMTETLNPISGTGQQISYTCPGAVTTCDGGNDPGLEQWEYRGVITITQQCPDWTFGVSECCRNAAITTIVDPTSDNLYVEAFMNNTIVNNNSSPIFSNAPIAFVCIGQNNFYNHGGFDIDGDSIVYSFATPLSDLNVGLTYTPGYSIANPISSVPGVTIDPQTGDIAMRPTTPEVGVIAVRILEYRNGQLIGSVVRDMQIYTVQCNNNLPLLSGINGSNDFSYSTCLAGQICFNINSSDTDATDTLTVTWNNGIPNGSLTTTGGPRPLATFCWTPTAADIRPQPYIFTVTVRDNACPSNGVQTFSYSITVSSVNVTISSEPVTCNGGNDGSAQVNVPTGTNYTYQWSPGGQTTSSINDLTAGSYSVTVSDNAGCSGTLTVTISQPSALQLQVNGVNGSCNGTAGSATAVVSGGTPPYQYVWNTNPAQTTSTISGLSSGNYTVQITDDNGCMTSGSVQISSSSTLQATMSSTPAQCAASNGTAAVNVSGGSGNYTYVWSPNVSNSSTAVNLAPGVYSVTVTDNVSGCVQNVSATVGNSSGINASIVSVNDAMCSNSEDGSATVLAGGGIPPYRFLWSNGDTTATVANLAPGTHTVTVYDYTGCPAVVSVTIVSMYPEPPLDLGADTTACIGDIVTLDAGPGMSYLWSDNSTMQTLPVTTSGLYSVLITDQNGCENFDTIEITFVSCSNNGTIIAEPSVSRKIKTVDVYPNPFTDKISISHPSNVEVFNMIIYNAYGEKVFESGQITDQVDLSYLAAGVYFMNLKVDEEQRLIQLIKK